MSNSFEQFRAKEDPRPAGGFDALAKLRAELAVDESLQWYEKPVPGYFIAGIMPLFLFGLCWMAFSLLWEGAAVLSVIHGGPNASYIFPLFGLPFILVGVWILSRPFHEYNKLKKTIYGITNKRAIVVTDNMVISYDPSLIGEIQRVEGKDGIGNLWFTEEVYYTNRGSRTVRSGFVRLKQLKEAENYLRELKK